MRVCDDNKMQLIWIDKKKIEQKKKEYTLCVMITTYWQLEWQFAYFHQNNDSYLAHSHETS